MVMYHFRNTDITNKVDSGQYKIFDQHDKALNEADKIESSCLKIMRTEIIDGKEIVSACYGVKIK